MQGRAVGGGEGLLVLVVVVVKRPFQGYPFFSFSNLSSGVTQPSALNSTVPEAQLHRGILISIAGEGHHLLARIMPMPTPLATITREPGAAPAGMQAQAQPQPPQIHQLSNRISEVRLGIPSAPLLYNSILLAPALLSAEECSTLIHLANARAEAVFGFNTGARNKQSTCRIRICDLAAEARALDQVLRLRVLSLLEEEQPAIAMHLFGHDANLSTLAASFSACEPAINIYTAGGDFEEHEDGYALSINVLLSNGAADFAGGGTRFQNENLAGLSARGLDAGEDTESEHHKSRRRMVLKMAENCSSGDGGGGGGGGARSSGGGSAGVGGGNGGDGTRSVGNLASAAGGNAGAAGGEEDGLGESIATTIFPEEVGMAVLFSGNVRHSGRTVTAGVRHLYVASFDLTEGCHE